MTSNTNSRVRPAAKFFFDGDKKFFVKGVTYGPFKPDREENYLGTPEQVQVDLALMRQAGLNVVRIYHSPPRWFLDHCSDAGMRVLVTLPWEKHVEFLRERSMRKQIAQNVRAAVKTHAGHPAIFGYLVGNEISSTMARWLGANRVIEFVEELIRIGRAIDPGALFSYATYPPTEYLLPQNSDFYCFNVYLHNQREFEAYLLRLQNLTGEHPLILGEFGMDTIRHSQNEQAEMLGWHIDSVVKCGLAGTVLFTWTDEWFTGGQEITDWAFGIVTRDRKPKKAFYTVEEKLGRSDSALPHLPLPRTPFVSVIVCSYNGARTLAACLESLGKLNYPAYEVILVDDGSTDDTAYVAAQFPSVRYIHQTNHGLSHARNTGAAAAKGDIFAYTDSDCMVDADWLYYLIGALVSGDYAGVGGPNITPPAQNWIQACVAAAPGGPSHVLLTDTIAEHIPGCNMAFYRWAFDGVGGFDPEYRKAGDDVDFCWRIQQAGWVIGFSPTAIVWHYRRFTLRAFLKQQDGYGEAESLLRFKHLIFFGPTGTAKWRGQIYGPQRFTWFIGRPVIYHGIFGEGFFQSIYPTPQSDVAAYLSSIEWFALTIFLFGLGIFLPALRIVPYLMLGGTLCVALSYMVRTQIEPRFDTVRARLLVMLLAFAQPLVRGFSRYFTWLHFKRTPANVIRRHEHLPERARSAGSLSRRAFWSEQGRDRHYLLGAMFELLDEEGWRYSTDSGWNEWDIQIYGNFWWSIALQTVTEYHGGGKCLTRVRLRNRLVTTTVIFSLIALSLLIYRQLNASHVDLWSIGAYLLFLLFLWTRARALKSRVAELVDVAALRANLQRVARKQKIAKPVAGFESEPAVNVTDPAAPNLPG
ncbi:MAG TPA: glycosyltransferase [Candidatus Udaeobacter sp.]|jgi:GT2 family glycosyltransferase|nr:glycosyltransferase [Candidatus Udaeobacter sp.]